MRLVSRFEQRKIGPTHGSIASLIPLKTPSGPQFTESELETELVEQLAFATEVQDIITQPIIRYRSRGKERRYTPDVLVEMEPTESGAWRYYLIEVKPLDHLDAFRTEGAEKIKVGTAWCATHNAEFRIVTEREIKTTFLANTRHLSMHVGTAPDPEHLIRMHRVLGTEDRPIAAVIADLKSAGLSEADARVVIERAVVTRVIVCDLAKPFDDATILTARNETHHAPDRADPIIRLLAGANCS